MGKCIWLTGLPCSGKTTIAKELLNHIDAVHLDGDVIRDTFLGTDVDFTPEGREKHILRMGSIASVLVKQGHNVICSFISPNLEVRQKVRDMFTEGTFISVLVDADKEVCKHRDVKGMWKKALAGEIKNFTGVDAEYEEGDYNLAVGTAIVSKEVCAKSIYNAVFKPKDKYAMFVGRWNGVMHNGHDHIIQSKLDEGSNVLLAVRDVVPDQNNPWTATRVKKMLEYRFRNDARVKVIIIPDIESVEYGRGVGYAVNEIKVTQDIAGISGTEIRRQISTGSKQWKQFVPSEIAEYLTQGA